MKKSEYLDLLRGLDLAGVSDRAHIAQDFNGCVYAFSGSPYYNADEGVWKGDGKSYIGYVDRFDGQNNCVVTKLSLKVFTSTTRVDARAEASSKPFAEYYNALPELVMAKRYVDKAMSAQERGIEFNLTLAEYTELRNTTVCAVSGKELNHLDFSLERIDPLGGYTKGNTVVMDKSLNSFKGVTLDKFLVDGPLTDEQKLKILNKIVYRLSKRIKEKV